MAKHSRKHSRRHRRFQQRGGDGYGYTGAAFPPSASQAPLESRVAFSHCGFPARPGSLVGGARRHRKSHRKQHGGGGGTGGYAINVSSNDIGKMYSSVDAGVCPGPVRGQMGGANMMDVRAIDSYSAGYGYAPASAVEVGAGTAHYLNQLPYGRQCMGGGYRKGRRSARRHTKKSRKSRRRHH
jgi:hypothetical protein